VNGISGPTTVIWPYFYFSSMTWYLKMLSHALLPTKNYQHCIRKSVFWLSLNTEKLQICVSGVVCWQVKLCDSHLSAFEVRFSWWGAIQIDHLYLFTFYRYMLSRWVIEVVTHFTKTGLLLLAPEPLSKLALGWFFVYTDFVAFGSHLWKWHQINQSTFSLCV